MGKLQAEMLPVPAEYVPKLWASAHKVVFAKIPNYDAERTHQRLLLGVDQLWVAHRTGRVDGHSPELVGVIVTAIVKRPPQQRKAWQRKDPAQRKTLLIHIAGHRYPGLWLPSAAERICRYARENGCRMLFLSARKPWTGKIRRAFYSPEWEVVAFSRDRPTYSTCKRFKARNTPGYYRQFVPVPAEKWTHHYYGFMSTAYFNEEEIHREPAA